MSTASTSKSKASSESFEPALLLATHLKKNQEGLITSMNQPTDKSFAQLRVEAENLGIISKDNAKQGKEELKEAISQATKDTNRGGGR